ncbi:MAG TPA: polysaccharide biosynthesis/export family protein, partial [Chitinophagaceae bacterium]|nr:polysaccharide biosynthesis/export family protein [Chitinophagaceae bacterium]
MRIFSLLFFAAALFFISCNPQKSVTNNYLLNVSDTTAKDSLPRQNLVIQKGDLLSIRVYSTAIGSQPGVDAPYNLPESGIAGTAGFIVDDNGNIEYPQIGLIHAEGLTRDQLAEVIKTKLQGQLNQPSVIVRYLNYRITILGEVGNPSTFTIPTER